MRTVIFFVALIAFVSCNIQPANEAVFAQVAKDPRADAVFATVSMKMKTQGGFSEIFGLLTQLVDDARSQAHYNKKIWFENRAHCRVAKFTIGGHLRFFENNLATVRQGTVDAKEQIANCEALKKARGNALKTYIRIKAKIEKEHSAAQDKLDKFNKGVSDANKALESAITAVENWKTGPAPAFLEENIHVVVEAYKTIKGFPLDTPSLVQTGASPDQLKNRLLHWLVGLEGCFAQISDEVTIVTKEGVKHIAAFEKDFAALVKDLKASMKILDQTVKYSKKYSAGLNKWVKQFEGLSKKVKSMQKTINKWCAVEKKEYQAAHKASVADLKLCKKIRNYFLNHYKKINAFIKKKYH